MLVVERVADVFKNRNIIYGELELGGLLSIYLLLLVEAWLGREDRGGVDFGTGSEGTLSRGAFGAEADLFTTDKSEPRNGLFTERVLRPNANRALHRGCWWPGPAGDGSLHRAV